MYLNYKFDTDVILQAIEDDDNLGFCTNCGMEHYSCEPDARDYDCEDCETDSVYGAEEILFHLVPM